MEILEITTTLLDPEEARQLALLAVRESIAACVQIDEPIRSIYRWEGKIEENEEFRVTLKTASSQKEQAIAWLLAHHPYDVPQIIVRHVETTSDYGNWVEE